MIYKYQDKGTWATCQLIVLDPVIKKPKAQLYYKNNSINSLECHWVSKCSRNEFKYLILGCQIFCFDLQEGQSISINGALIRKASSVFSENVRGKYYFSFNAKRFILMGSLSLSQHWLERFPHSFLRMLEGNITFLLMPKYPY